MILLLGDTRRQQSRFHVLHERFGATKEECMFRDFDNALHDELAAEAASRACPTA